MNGLLTLLTIALFAGIITLRPVEGSPAVILCLALAGFAGVLIARAADKFVTQVFVFGLLLRVAIGTTIYLLSLQEFFGGDAVTYDEQGHLLSKVWAGELARQSLGFDLGFSNWGMPYLVGAVYSLVGRNPLAVQYVNAVIGAATAAVIYLCASHIFRNERVAHASAVLVAFYPSLVLWSSQGLKDGPVVFLLALAILATLKVGERMSVKFVAVLVVSFLGLLSLRFYVFYMITAAVAGSLVIGMRPITSQSLLRQLVIVLFVGLALTYVGVLRTASVQFETYGSLEAVQRSRLDLAESARSGFAGDVDVSTTSGAITVIPLGIVYLLFAPFPWQLANLRQAITLPEMLIWWASFPLLVLGGWFTVKYRLRQALPILIFTSMLTLAYSVFQGNVGTAYRQRAQILVFYFIFVAVGYALLRERRDEERLRAAARRAEFEAEREERALARSEAWRRGRGAGGGEAARALSERVNS